MWILVPAPNGEGYVFIFVGLSPFVYQQHYENTRQWIFMKFSV